MNADALPLGFAPVRLIARSVDGEESVLGCYRSEDLAESVACELRQLGTSTSYRVVRETPVLPGLEGCV